MNSSISPSLRGLCRVSFPLMLMALSGNLMLILDRLILARYSLEAMNSAATAGMSAAIFQFSGVAIASIAEVFVGRYNGAGQYHRLAQPVWQMIWFSMGTLLVCWPIACRGGWYLLPTSLHAEGIPYFRLIMLFSPVLSIIAALSAFFIGRGQVRLVTISAIAANLSNFIFDIILIFGIKGYLPAMGTTGAALATVIAEFIQVGLLAAVFLNSHHRRNFHTHHASFNASSFWMCLRIGMPSAIGHMIEISAWAALFRIMASVHLDYVTVHTIGNSVLVLFAFVTDGLQKGVIAIASNLIGAKKERRMPELIFSSLRLQMLFIAFFSIPLLFCPQIILDYFFASAEVSASLYQDSLKVLRWVWVYFVCDGFVWVLAGILTAGGDTRFIMTMNALSAWLFAIIPVFIGVTYYHISASTAWALTAFYSFANMIAFLSRYKSQKWNHKIIHHGEERVAA